MQVYIALKNSFVQNITAYDGAYSRKTQHPARANKCQKYSHALSTSTRTTDLPTSCLQKQPSEIYSNN